MKNKKGQFKKGSVPWNYKGEKPTCIDCNKRLSNHNTIRCQKCYGISISGKNSFLWKGGLPCCLDCSKKLSTKKSKRCLSCNIKWKKIPENSPHWKNGISKTPGYKNNIRKKIRLNIVGFHIGKEWEELKKKFNYMCLCCKKQEPLIKLTEDHIIPLSVSGSDYISNIQPLCQSCNSRKHTKTINYIELCQQI